MGTIPDMENVVKIGRYFDCSLDYLMNNELDSKENRMNRFKDRCDTQGYHIERAFDWLHSDRNNTFLFDAVICKIISGI